MEIKYTLEILTKDIQDIEKLVGKLQNSPDGTAIELDLALSKLRNVYEILTLIKADRLHELVSPHFSPESEATHSTRTSGERLEEKAAEDVKEEVKETATEVMKEEVIEKAAGILAEKFSAESSINENIAVKRGKHVDTKLTGQPIDNISRNIGINDRFLIIRELFDGDTNRFNILVDKLEAAGGYQHAVNVLLEEFPGEMDHEGVEILSGLLQRRFSKH